MSGTTMIFHVRGSRCPRTRAEGAGGDPYIHMEAGQDAQGPEGTGMDPYMRESASPDAQGSEGTGVHPYMHE